MQFGLRFGSPMTSGCFATVINLTNMWQANGSVEIQRPRHWLDQISTGQFIEAVNKKFKLNSGLSLKTKAGRYGGTFAHWQIGMAYAKYLSPKFHIRWLSTTVWCNEVVRERFQDMADPELGLERAAARAKLAFIRRYQPISVKKFDLDDDARSKRIIQERGGGYRHPPAMAQPVHLPAIYTNASAWRSKTSSFY